MTAESEPGSRLSKAQISAGIVVLLIAALVVLDFVGRKQGRALSQDKVALGNARALAAAQDQYFLEHTVTSVSFSALVNATAYVKSINSVAGESYPTTFARGRTITVTGIAGARTITYAP